MDLQLSGRTALVTGGTGGIGRAIVEGLAAEGAEVALCALYSTALALNPTGRMASPEEIAFGVVVLASPRASFISGTHLVVDGALTRGVQL